MIVCRSAIAVAIVAQLAGSPRHHVAPAPPWSVRMAESVMRRSPVVTPRWDYTAGLVLLGIARAIT